MYHKKPDKPTMTLAEWINGKDSTDMARPTKQESIAKKLRIEKADLKDKILKLGSSLINADSFGITPEDATLLKIQRNAMTTYCSVLDARIHRYATN